MTVSTHPIIADYQAAYRSYFHRAAPKVRVSAASGKKFRILHPEGSMIRTEAEMKLITGMMNDLRENVHV